MSSKRYDEFTAGTPVKTDIVLFADPSTGALEKVTIDGLQSATGAIRKVKITKSYTDFAVADTENDIPIVLMPVGTVVIGVIMNVTTAFGPNSYNISLGKTGDSTYYRSLLDCEVNGDLYPRWEIANDDWTTTVMIRAFATSLSNLNTATTGSVDIYIYYLMLD